MKSLSKALFLLMLSVACALAPAQARGENRQADRAIPSFLNEQLRNKSIVLNAPRFNENAIVYYLKSFEVPEEHDTLNRTLGYLAIASRKLQKKGAELILYTAYSDFEADDARELKRPDINRLARLCSVKSPIINIQKPTTQRVFFKKKNGTPQRKVPEGFMAVDADGIPMAYFEKRGRTIVMYDEDEDNPYELTTVGRNDDEWEPIAIQASYKQLIEKARKRQLKKSGAIDSEETGTGSNWTSRWRKVNLPPPAEPEVPEA